jgi:cellulose synthase (UDP-forming)
MTLANLPHRAMFRPPLATLVMFGAIVMAVTIVIAWFAGHGTISMLFAQLNDLQQNPPGWAMPPVVIGRFFFFWAVGLMLLVFAITRFAPTPTRWSRPIVVGILVILSLRYLLWRSTSTLNLSSPKDGVFSLGLFFLELLILTSGTIQLVLLLRVRDRCREADRLSGAVLSGDFTPTVDILIPTYDEPAFILKRTIIGCQAMDYAPKTVYVLDDTRRPCDQSIGGRIRL